MGLISRVSSRTYRKSNGSLQQSGYQSMGLQEVQNPDMEQVKQLNEKSAGFNKSSSLCTWFNVQKTKLKIQMTDVKKSLDYVRMLKRINQSGDDGNRTNYFPVGQDQAVRVPAQFDSEKPVVIVSIGAKVYLEYNYDEAEKFFTEQIERGEKQLKEAEEDLEK